MSEKSTASRPRHIIAKEDRIPMKEKVAFGAGGVARGIQETADNMLMNPVFVLGVGIAMYWLYTPKAPWLSILPGIFFGPAMSALWVLIPSMTGDIVDDDELRTGERREGAFSSLFSWITKVSLTVAIGMSGFLVSWSGYRSEIRHDLPPDVIDRMRILVVAVPSGVILIALLILMLYPIDEDTIDENREKLQKRRGKITA
jgi:GPH family glycoside/pentoside/hexuronide:cation symporter